MPTVVIDASALAAILFGELDAEQVAVRIDGANLAAPRLLRHELVSVANKKLRANPAQRTLLIEGLRSYPGFNVREYTINAAATFEIAVETGLSAYDASYLWLAHELGAALVTLDGELAGVVGRVG